VTELIWSPQAIRDLEAIHAYIAIDSPTYAEPTVRRIFSAIERLAVFSESGRMGKAGQPRHDTTLSCCAN
jgi:plasmid stabilization system protein ParE